MNTHAHAADRLNPVALITGAASGIGAALAHRLSPRATGGLILIDQNERGLAKLADSLAEPPERVSTLAFDVADPERWARAGDFILDHYGRLDWAAANAGVAHAAAIADMSYDEWRRVLGVNLDGVFLTLKAAMPIMRLNQQGGSIVITASASGVKAEPNVAAYGASKAAALHLAKVAAREGAPHRIRVNAIAPGGVETPMWRDQPFFQDLMRETGSERAAFDRLAADATPLGRYASADEVAELMEMLLCGATPMTGAMIVVDGGYTL